MHITVPAKGVLFILKHCNYLMQYSNILYFTTFMSSMNVLNYLYILFGCQKRTWIITKPRRSRVANYLCKLGQISDPKLDFEPVLMLPFQSLLLKNHPKFGANRSNA